MGFFSRRPKQPELPGNIVSRLERFGQYEFNSQAYAFDGPEMGELVGELYAFASSDPERFLVALAQAVLPVGGWAVYGASCILWECFSSDAGVLAQHPAYKAIRESAINFLRSNGVPPMRVKGYEWQYWTDNGGTSETWIQRRPIPALAEAPITDLRPGEVRRVTQLTAERDSNAILVRQNSDGRCCAMVDAKQSDEDPRRDQWEWKFAESLHELYIQIGLAMQVPTFWYDREIEPYFPLPRPSI